MLVPHHLINILFSFSLVDFDNTVDFSDEKEGGKETNGSRHNEEQEHNDERVAKVEKHAGGIGQAELGLKVVDAVDEEIDGGEARGDEASPPPVVVLGTEVEVAEENGGLRAGDDENEKHEEEKSEHVVRGAGPNGTHDEVELNEDAAEGQNASHYNTGDGLGVHGLLWDLTRNLVGPHRVLYGPFAESEERPDEGERHGDPDPQGDQSKESAEGNRCRASLGPEYQIHHEEETEHDARHQG